MSTLPGDRIGDLSLKHLRLPARCAETDARDDLPQLQIILNCTSLTDLSGIEVYPKQVAEWWFVPVAAGRVTDLRCGIVGADGRTHAEHGMVGEIVID
jgi:hypothetical protein